MQERPLPASSTNREDLILGKKGDATKNPPDPCLVALAQHSIKKSGIRRLARTNLSLPDRDRARTESLGKRSCPSMGLEKGVDKRSNARGRGKNQEQPEE